MVKHIFVLVFDSRRWSKGVDSPGDENGLMEKSPMEYFIRKQESIFLKVIRMRWYFAFFGDVMKF